MNKKNKIVLIAILIVGIIGCLLICLQKNSVKSEVSNEIKNAENARDEAGIDTATIVKKEYKDKVRVDRLQRDKKYTVCSADFTEKAEGIVNQNKTDISFSTGISLEEIISSNIEAYVGRYNNKYSNYKNGVLMYEDNNYYLINSEENTDLYYCLNLCGNYAYEDGYMNVVLPCDITLDWGGLCAYIFVKENCLDEIFTYSFNELKEFYGRLDSDLCKIDSDNEIISVYGCFNRNGKILKDALTIDVKNKRLFLKLDNGNVGVWENKAYYEVSNKRKKKVTDRSLLNFKADSKGQWIKSFYLNENNKWVCDNEEYEEIAIVIDPVVPLSTKPQYIVLAKKRGPFVDYDKAKEAYDSDKKNDDFCVVGKQS